MLWQRASAAADHFKTLKVEGVYDYEFVDQQKAATTVFECIEIGYNGSGRPPKKNPFFARVSDHSTDGATFKPICFSCLIYCPIIALNFVAIPALFFSPIRPTVSVWKVNYYNKLLQKST